jgi:hypothetical protein
MAISSFNADWGDNFYYQGFLTGVPAGEYFYTFRFKLGDDPYKYAGTDGLWNGTTSVSKPFTVNPSNLPQITWANLQWEAATVINEGESFEAGAVVFADGLTNVVNSTTGEGMLSDIGYSSSNSDPSSDSWTWQSVPFNADWGDNFYYQGSLTGVPAGEYFYTFRFKLGDDPYKYAGTDGLWNGTTSVSKPFTVNPSNLPQITWAYLQWEAATTIDEGEPFDAGAVVFADGLTNAVNSTTGEGITSDIGYSSSNTDPSSAGWTWQSVPFNADWGDNFYYQGSLTGVPAGAYFYTFRFKLGDDPYKYAGTDGLWNGTTSVNKSFTVNSVTDITSNEFKSPSISIHPNPVTNGVINLVLNNLTAGEYDLILVDMTGQVIQNNKLQCAAGTNIFNIPTTAAKGVYLVQLSSPANAGKLNLKTVIE